MPPPPPPIRSTTPCPVSSVCSNDSAVCGTELAYSDVDVRRNARGCAAASNDATWLCDARDGATASRDTALLVSASMLIRRCSAARRETETACVDAKLKQH
eukprot:3073415-Rhodomonas_salina.2